jgi:hypothetical protein
MGSHQRRKYILLPLLKLSAIILIATVIGIIWLGIRSEQLLMIVGLTWIWIFLMHLMPLLIMGFRHSRLSKEAHFTIDTVNNICYYNEKDLSLSFNLTDVDTVIKVVSPPKYDKRIDILGFGHFFYWKIVLSDSRTLSLSCMLLDVDDFPGKKISSEKRLFPVPPPNHQFQSQNI